MSLLAVLCAGALVASACGSGGDGGAEGEVELVLASSLPAGHPMSENGARVFMEKATELSGGRIQFEHYPAEQLAPANELYNAAQGGAADIVYVSAGYASDSIPAAGVPELPWGEQDIISRSEAYWEILNKPVLQETFEAQSLKPVMAWTLDSDVLAFTDTKVTEAADLQGLNIRSGGGMRSITLDAIGVTPVEMPATETLTALERGTLDGVAYPLPSMPPYEVETATSYLISNAALGSAGILWLMNQDAWESLPPDLQSALDEAGEYAMQEWNEFNSQDRDRLIAEWEEKGVLEIYALSDETLAKLEDMTSGVAEDWARQVDGAGAPGTETLELWQAAMAERN